MSPYFSKRSIVKLKPIIHKRISRLCMHLKNSMHQTRVVDLDFAFAAFMADIVTYHFYRSHLDYLGNKNFRYALRNAILGVIKFYHLTRFLLFLMSNIKRLPIPIIWLPQPVVVDLLYFQAKIQ